MINIQKVLVLNIAYRSKFFLYLIPGHFHILGLGSTPFHKVQIFTLTMADLQG